MESERLLLLSKYLATFPFLRPDEHSPRPRTYFFQAHFIVILPSMPKSFKRTVYFRFPHQNHVWISGPLHEYNIYLQFRPCLLHHSFIIWRGIKTTKILIILYYITLYYIILYCIVLHCIVLYYIILFSILLPPNSKTQTPPSAPSADVLS
jgi:hypothetical protein